MTDRFDDLMRDALETAAGSAEPSPAAPAAERLLAARAAGTSPARGGRRLWGSLAGPGPVARRVVAGGAAALAGAAVAAAFVLAPGGGRGAGSVAASRGPERTSASAGAAGGPSGGASAGAGALSGGGGPSGGVGSGTASSAGAAPAPAGTPPVAPATTAPTTTAPTTTAPTTTAPAPATVTLGPADDGRTVTVSVGTRIQVNLSGGGYSWGAPSSSDPSVLQETASGTDPATGAASGEFLARSPGSATISAEARPQCPAGQACPALVRLWRVTIRVAPAP